MKNFGGGASSKADTCVIGTKVRGMDIRKIGCGSAQWINLFRVVSNGKLFYGGVKISNSTTWKLVLDS
jgi:hypothetical protein